MEDNQQSRDASYHTARLDRTLTALQERVREQEAVLKQLRESTTQLAPEPSSDPKAYLRQLRALKATYETLIPAEPWLPVPDSPLPALLALRRTSQCIQETQAAIVNSTSDLKNKTQRLEAENADRKDAKLIHTAIETRISSLQVRIDEQTQKSPGQIGKEMIAEVKKKAAYYDKETGKLVAAFNSFIDDHLAVLLAAEELGGPIVGDELDIDEKVLEGGFNNQGRARRSTNTKKPTSDGKRQRRIDEIWGARPSAEDGRGSNEPWNEKEAAAAEMRELTEQLLNSLVEAGGNGPGTYVTLQRESAAARFLVRSKVAQFHPKDATRLRLLDFGGELDE